MRRIGVGTALLGLAFFGLAAAARAAETDVPDRVYVELGGFNVDFDSNLRLSSQRLGGSAVDFEQELAVPENANRGFADVYWRAGRRHLLNASVARLHREGPGRALTDSLNWGDVVFPAGLTVSGRVESTYLSGAYRFAAYRNSSFEIGPALGFGYVWVDAGIRAQIGSGGPALEQEAGTSSPTGDLGGYFRGWVSRRVLVRGDARYILVKPENAEAAVTEARIGVSYYPWRKVGFGAQYVYTRFRYERGTLASELSGSYRYQGFQLVGSLAF